MKAQRNPFLDHHRINFEIDEVIQSDAKPTHVHVSKISSFHKGFRMVEWFLHLSIFYIPHERTLLLHYRYYQIKTFLCKGNFFSIIMFKMTNRCIISYTSLLTTIYIYNVRLDSRFRTLQELTNLKDFVNCIINNLTFK